MLRENIDITSTGIYQMLLIYNISFSVFLIIQFCKTAKDSQWFRNGKHSKNEHSH